jgi:hypothetical protein
MEVISYVMISAFGAFMISCIVMTGYVFYIHVLHGDNNAIAQQIENPPLQITVPLRFYVQGEIPSSTGIRRNTITVEANKHNYTRPITIDESLFKVIDEDEMSIPNSIPLTVAVII